MIIILGAGISGLMLAHRLRERGERFLILDRLGINMSGNDMGFFYAHERSELTKKEPFKIYIRSCPGGTTESYIKKVYGDARPEKVSFEKYADPGKILEREGWQYDYDFLREEVKSGELKIVDVTSLDFVKRVVYTKQGFSWQYRKILSTIPLPILEKMSPWAGMMGPSGEPFVFRSKPIYLRHVPIKAKDEWIEQIGTNGMGVTYCASDCHSWYRETIHVRENDLLTMARQERMTQEGADICLKPGKIWYQNEFNKYDIESLIRECQLSGVYCFGRYGTWRPKYLTSDVWSESEKLGSGSYSL